MEPISLLTLAAVAGSSIIGKKLLEKGTEHVWETFIGRLRNKAKGNEQAVAALATLRNPEQVQAAIQAIGAEQDEELRDLAEQITTSLRQHTPVQYQQIAEKIINIQTNYGSIIM
jgi:hypothetical protein